MLTILQGDALLKLRELPTESVQCCVTSPPYWGLRDYSANGQLGLEKTPEEYVAKMVELFREVRRVLRKDGTLWLNLGDSYAANGISGLDVQGEMSTSGKANPRSHQKKTVPVGLKPKDLVGIPWRVAFALQADGWWLRQDIIWSKPNPMPESVTDRCTKAHEYLFMLTKSARYFYDAEAIKEPYAASTLTEFEKPYTGEAIKDYASSGVQNPSAIKKRITDKQRGHYRRHEGFNDRWDSMPKIAQQINGANKRSVWTVATAPYPEAHFATYPPDLIKPCILAGTSSKGCCVKCGAPWERIVERSGGTIGKGSWHNHENDLGRGQRGGDNSNVAADAYSKGDYKVETLGWAASCKCNWGHSDAPYKAVPCTVVDPFAGSGTTGQVSLELGRSAILIELNPAYIPLIKSRCSTTIGLPL